MVWRFGDPFLPRFLLVENLEFSHPQRTEFFLGNFQPSNFGTSLKKNWKKFQSSKFGTHIRTYKTSLDKTLNPLCFLPSLRCNARAGSFFFCAEPDTTKKSKALYRRGVALHRLGRLQVWQKSKRTGETRVNPRYPRVVCWDGWLVAWLVLIDWLAGWLVG